MRRLEYNSPIFNPCVYMISEQLPGSAVANLPPVPWWASVGSDVVSELNLDSARGTKLGCVDVAIIGGGIAGLSTAASAARNGLRAVVLERGHMLGLGASGQNAGIVCIGANMPLADVLANPSATRLWNDTAQAAEQVFELSNSGKSYLRARKTGSLFLARSRTAAQRMKGEMTARKQLGMRAEIVSAAEASSLGFGKLDVTAVHCALYLADEGRAHPLTLLAHLAQSARRAGAELYGHAHVVKCEPVTADGGSRVWRLFLADGTTVDARSYVRCVGPTVEANSRIYALAFKHEMPEQFPVFQDAAPYTYYDYRCGDGYVTVSGGRYGKAGNSSPDRFYFSKMCEAARQWLPELESIEPANRWSVDLRVASDMVPEIVEQDFDGARALTIQGLGALGVLPGFVLGRQAGERLAKAIKAVH